MKLHNFELATVDVQGLRCTNYGDSPVGILVMLSWYVSGLAHVKTSCKGKIHTNDFMASLTLLHFLLA